MRPGYTLFELMLVLAVLVIMAALAFPTLESMSGPFRLDQASDMVRARWAQGRSRAINEGRAYRFGVLANQGNFRLAPDGPEFWPSGGKPGDGLVEEGTLPKGVRFNMAEPSQSQAGAAPSTNGNNGGPWQTVATFLPDGSAQDDVEITFTTTGARPVALKLRALTGAVTHRTLPLGRGGNSAGTTRH